MLYIAENLKSLRKGMDLTQEEIAEMLNVSPQSVSKWERGDTYPDITMLPALANLYKTSVDVLIGMDKINDRQTRSAIFTAAHNHIRNGDMELAVEVYSDGLKTFPNDEDIMSDLAMALALSDGSENLTKAVMLCERVLSDNQGDKVHHTTRAALCFVYMKAGEKEKALSIARRLPHVRESREIILAFFEAEPTADEVDSYLKFIAVGEQDEQDIITVDFGVNMVSVATEHNVLAEIKALRGGDGCNKEGLRKLPMVRVRDNCQIPPNQVRVRHFAEYLLDEEFTDSKKAVDEIIAALRSVMKG
jgi:transcriptional regulator with XRE-family HTH domain